MMAGMEYTKPTYTQVVMLLQLASARYGAQHNLTSCEHK